MILFGSQRQSNDDVSSKSIISYHIRGPKSRMVIYCCFCWGSTMFDRIRWLPGFRLLFRSKMAAPPQIIWSIPLNASKSPLFVRDGELRQGYLGLCVHGRILLECGRSSVPRDIQQRDVSLVYAQSIVACLTGQAEGLHIPAGSASLSVRWYFMGRNIIGVVLDPVTQLTHERDCGLPPL